MRCVLLCASLWGVIRTSYWERSVELPPAFETKPPEPRKGSTTQALFQSKVLKLILALPLLFIATIALVWPGTAGK